jgi:hypothetical protein
VRLHIIQSLLVCVCVCVCVCVQYAVPEWEYFNKELDKSAYTDFKMIKFLINSTESTTRLF